MATHQAKPGDTVELRDKETGFTDAETGFDISRDQQVKLGDTIGQRTNVALASGALLLVSSKKAKAADDTDDVDNTSAAKAAASKKK